ncbi:MAG TPA: LacI family DNA-binding transcriptional regulator [Chitinophagaceae bacterium]|jgi:LacI family transcriptional regulator|nr:LacI family DNA-binding transcriptional regulator [Chitinophagaceae bacterium]
MEPPYKKNPSLKDIARLVGVSPSTISFVLNGKARQMRISAAVEEKVLVAVRETGYVPNPVAVSLRTGRSKILGLIVESVSGSFFSSLARIIENEAGKRGYKVIYCSTENNAKRGGDWIRTLSELQVDGYIITPAQGMEKSIMELVAHHKPVVLMDSFFPAVEVPYVLTDNTCGVIRGMSHLQDKNHDRIGFITSDLRLIQMKRREDAYSDYMRDRKLRGYKKLLLKLPYGCQKEEAVRRIAAFIKDTPDLEAVFFAANYLGVWGLESVTRLGLKIPRDLAVICFDDHDIFRLYPPGITVIQQPVEKIAEVAIRLLMSQLGASRLPVKQQQVLLTPKLVVRKST